MITRYDPDVEGVGAGEYTWRMNASLDGDYVTYDDHLAAVEAAIAARIASGELVALPEGRDATWFKAHDGDWSCSVVMERHGKPFVQGLTYDAKTKAESVRVGLSHHMQMVADLLRAQRDLAVQDGE